MDKAFIEMSFLMESPPVNLLKIEIMDKITTSMNSKKKTKTNVQPSSKILYFLLFEFF